MATFEKVDLLFYCGLFINRCSHYRSPKIAPLCICFSMEAPEKLDISLQIKWVIVELKKWKDVTILEF